MKNFLIPFLLIGFMAFGQKPSLGLQSIEAVNKEKDYVEAEMIFQTLKELFVKSDRFNILDRESLGLVHNEQEIQKQIGSINADVIRQGQIAGAKHIVGGKLMNLEYKEGKPKITLGGLLGDKSSDENKTSYTPVFSFSLNIIDAETSKTIHSKTFKSGSLSLNLFESSKQESFQSALKALEDNITKDFINNFFAESIDIVAIEDEENGEATMLLINVGNKNGAEKNDKLNVYLITTLDLNGEEVTREQEIAEIKIVAVEGDELSTAKVLDGGSELLSNFNTGETLICKSK